MGEGRIPFAHAFGVWLSPALFGAWWARLRGRLQPRPCPYSLAAAFEVPGRRLVAGAERILDAFGIRVGETVLEIGPGTGFYSIEAARRVGGRGRLVCLDIQPDMLHHTKRRLEARGLEARFVQADAHVLPLRPSLVDHVILIGVLGEIPDRAAAVAEMRRVLRPGGRLSVSEQFPDPDFVTQRALRRELAAAGFAEEETRGWLFYTSRWFKGGPSSGAEQEHHPSTSQWSQDSVGSMRSALLAATVLALPMAAYGHDTWVLPVRWSVPVRERLVVDLTSAMDFPAPETAAQADRLVAKSIRLDGAVSSLEVSPVHTGAKALQLSATPTAPGVATVWIATRPRTLDLKPAEVEHYLEEVGAADTLREQWRRSPDKAWRETYVKIAKTFVRVGNSQRDDSWKEPVAAALELVPASDPTALSSGQDLAFLLLWNGKPIGNLAVGAVGASSAKPVLIKTDAEGHVTFRLDRPGPWLFRATLVQSVAGRSGEWQSLFTTVTVDVKP